MSQRARDGALIAALALALLVFLILPFALYQNLGARLPGHVAAAPGLALGLIALAPAFPALAVVTMLQHRLKWLTRTLAVLCLVVAAIGNLLLLLIVGMGPSYQAGLQLALVVILAQFWWICLHAVWRYSAPADANRGLSMELQAVAIAAVALPIAWSLGSGALAAGEAAFLASGRPYCLAMDRFRPAKPGADYGTITSVADLTGMRFHSTRTGYKDTSRWYFHALLLVQDGDNVQYWYWSHSQLRYFPFPYHPVEQAIARPIGACIPKAHFLSTLGI